MTGKFSNSPNDQTNLDAAELFGKYAGKPKEYFDSGSVSFNRIFSGPGLPTEGVPRGICIELMTEEAVVKDVVTALICQSICDSGENVLYLDVANDLESEFLNKFNLPSPTWDFSNSSTFGSKGAFHVRNALNLSEVDQFLEQAFALEKPPQLVVVNGLSTLRSTDEDERRPDIFGKRVYRVLQRCLLMAREHGMNCIFAEQVTNDNVFIVSNKLSSMAKGNIDKYATVQLLLHNRSYLSADSHPSGTVVYSVELKAAVSTMTPVDKVQVLSFRIGEDGKMEFYNN